MVDMAMKRPEIDDPELNELCKKIKKEARLRKFQQEIMNKKRKERSDKIKATHSLHDKLVKLGSAWLMNNTPTKGNFDCSKCNIVTTEIVTFAAENPDVLGFANDNNSVLLEAKISKEDFKRDFKKDFRINPGKGMGDFRLYIAPEGLIKVEELPPKWGLIEVNDKDKCRIVKYAERQQSNKANEFIVLTSLIKRIGQNAPEGVSIRCYTYETKNIATLTVNKKIED